MYNTYLRGRLRKYGTYGVGKPVQVVSAGNQYVLHSAELCTESNMEQVNFGILKEEIDKVIESLPESRRLIYALSCEEHMSNVEIAQRLDISVKTVETQLGRVTKALREHLKKFV